MQQEMTTRLHRLDLSLILPQIVFTFGQSRRYPLTAHMAGACTRPLRAGAISTATLEAFRLFVLEIKVNTSFLLDKL